MIDQDRERKSTEGTKELENTGTDCKASDVLSAHSYCHHSVMVLKGHHRHKKECCYRKRDSIKTLPIVISMKRV